MINELNCYSLDALCSCVRHQLFYTRLPIAQCETWTRVCLDTVDLFRLLGGAVHLYSLQKNVGSCLPYVVLTSSLTVALALRAMKNAKCNFLDAGTTQWFPWIIAFPVSPCVFDTIFNGLAWTKKNITTKSAKVMGKQAREFADIVNFWPTFSEYVLNWNICYATCKQKDDKVNGKLRKTDATLVHYWDQIGILIFKKFVDSSSSQRSLIFQHRFDHLGLTQ